MVGEWGYRALNNFAYKSGKSDEIAMYYYAENLIRLTLAFAFLIAVGINIAAFSKRLHDPDYRLGLAFDTSSPTF